MSRSRFAGLTCGILLSTGLGCSSTSARQPEPTPAEPAASAFTDSTAEQEAPAPKPIPYAELPRGLHVLGEECGYPVAPHVYCGEAGVIVGVYAPVDKVRGVPPPEASTVREEPRMELAPGASLTIAAEGERLWVHRVTCGGCKQVMGWAFVGDLPGMKDDQLRDLQKRLEIGEDAPLLSTVEDWRIFYKDRPMPDPVEPR